MVSREDWLLCFIAGTEGYDGWVDRIRVMKGMFLFQHEGAPPAEANYAFRPYDYGPFTPDVYRDLEALAARGLIVSSPDMQSFRATEAGRALVAQLNYSAPHRERLEALRIEVGELGFRQLLRRVYVAHPDYAVRSRAKDVVI